MDSIRGNEVISLNSEAACSSFAVSFLADGVPKLGLQSTCLSDEVTNGVRKRFLWAVVGGGLYSQDELVLEWMRHLVTCE